MKLKRYVSLVLTLGVCGCSPTAPTNLLPAGWEQHIVEEWNLAQTALECLGYLRARSITPEMFEWKVHPSTIRCGSYPAVNACFSPGENLIHFNAQIPTGVRHEAGHAILLKLRVGSKWKCFEHANDPSRAWCPRGLLYPWECKAKEEKP